MVNAGNAWRNRLEPDSGRNAQYCLSFPRAAEHAGSLFLKPSRRAPSVPERSEQHDPATQGVTEENGVWSLISARLARRPGGSSNFQRSRFARIRCPGFTRCLGNKMHKLSGKTCFLRLLGTLGDRWRFADLANTLAELHSEGW